MGVENRESPELKILQRIGEQSRAEYHTLLSGFRHEISQLISQNVPPPKDINGIEIYYDDKVSPGIDLFKGPQTLPNNELSDIVLDTRTPKNRIIIMASGYPFEERDVENLTFSIIDFDLDHNLVIDGTGARIESLEKVQSGLMKKSGRAGQDYPLRGFNGVRSAGFRPKDVFSATLTDLQIYKKKVDKFSQLSFVHEPAALRIPTLEG